MYPTGFCSWYSAAIKRFCKKRYVWYLNVSKQGIDKNVNWSNWNETQPWSERHVTLFCLFVSVLLLGEDLPRPGAIQRVGRLGDLWLSSARPGLRAQHGPNGHRDPGRREGQSSREVSDAVLFSSHWLQINLIMKPFSII